MKRRGNLWHMVRDVLFGTPVRRKYDKVEAAIKAKAEAMSQREFHLAMWNFYTARVEIIEPHLNWWGFAEAKQKQYDHSIEAATWEDRVEEADGVLAARDAELKVLEGGPTTDHSKVDDVAAE